MPYKETQSLTAKISTEAFLLQQSRLNGTSHIKISLPTKTKQGVFGAQLARLRQYNILQKTNAQR